MFTFLPSFVYRILFICLGFLMIIKCLFQTLKKFISLCFFFYWDRIKVSFNSLNIDLKDFGIDKTTQICNSKNYSWLFGFLFAKWLLGVYLCLLCEQVFFFTFERGGHHFHEKDEFTYKCSQARSTNVMGWDNCFGYRHE